ncbi:MAG: HD domain-containing protein, partial [Deltaproteobacteria bacterium]|nr:HD domain-containing protein [Deltaproteobacteria bacterium]
EAYAAIIPIVLQHHERFDGKGYPNGLSGNAIHLGARILAVADAFDAMRSDRPYRV